MNAPLGDTISTGAFGLFHNSDELLGLSGITASFFAETTLSVGHLVDNGILELRLARDPNSDPVALYRPWLYITDSIAPGVTGDLPVTAGYQTGLRIEWTAAGDDGTIENAAIYEIRYSKWPLTGDTLEWWGYAEQAAGVPSPANPGTHEVFTVSELDTASTYFFILVTHDEALQLGLVDSIVGENDLLATAKKNSKWHIAPCRTGLRQSETAYQTADSRILAGSRGGLSPRICRYLVLDPNPRNDSRYPNPFLIDSSVRLYPRPVNGIISPYPKIRRNCRKGLSIDIDFHKLIPAKHL
jgi:hypothetical protein